MPGPRGKPQRADNRSKIARPARPVPARRSDTPLAIVGIGASAGGFEAFTQLLEALPAKPNIAIIFVQHLAPKHASALTALLTRHTRLHVMDATEGARVWSNCVYVVPPNAQIELIDSHLHLGRRPDDRTQYTPIDFFFRSLARTLRDQAVGVVLSGTASDGTLGVREIKAMGGITLVQEPGTAKYDGMPRSAIATQMVDLVLPPAEIAVKLAEIAAHPYLKPAPVAKKVEGGGERPVTDDQLDRVFKSLLPACGVNFTHYKTPTIVRRLQRRMALLRIDDVDAYIAHLEETPGEAANLHSDLLIHVTRFFREPDALEASCDALMTALESRPDASVRIWVAGCATGEEAYSLAIILHERHRDQLGNRRIQIFGTDVSETAVEVARHALYPSSITSDVSPERLERFFTKGDGGYRVAKALRDMCVFARHDLTRDPPFSRLDLICCRNVLIYMDGDLQKKLLAMFHYALRQSGVLLLGHAETIGYNSDLFSLTHKAYRIFRKKPGTVSAADLDLGRSQRVDAGARPPRAAANPTHLALNDANRLVLDRFAPPSVLVDQNFHVVQFNGQTGLFLEPSPGEPSFHILKLAREGLLHGLRSALYAARKTRRRTRRQGLRVRHGTTWRDIDVEVIPMMQQSHVFYLVLFQNRDAVVPETESKRRDRPGRAGTARNVAKLEEELAATREYLQSTIQEIEAANEELQSANEEILSSNEELQSTNEELDTAKEELQSTNEELNTVNDELQGRNEELTRVNTDLVNLLGSVQIAIVIVSRDRRIRRFTPMAEKLFNLIPGDLGRPFSQITPQIDCPNLTELIGETIDSVTPVERTVQDKDGKTYVLRIRPYTSPDNRIDGAVLALFDVVTTTA
jgi:two-component system, chemotaxis family, CheB/CheR fusion protein